MTTLQTYAEMAEALEEHAPVQGQLLRYLLTQEEMQEAAVICADLSYTDSNFRQLVNKLRGRGVELVCVRTHDPDGINVNVRYVYGIRADSVVDWEQTRKKAVMTAWERMSKMFERNIKSLGLEAEEVHKVMGAMDAAKLILEHIDFSLATKYAAIEAKEALAASALAEAEELRTNS